MVASYIRKLTSFGTWTFIASLVGGAMITGIIDRFFVGNILDVDQLYLIAIPFDLLSRLALLPAALSVMVLGFLSIKNTHNFGNVKNNIKHCTAVYSSQMLPIICIALKFRSRLTFSCRSRRSRRSAAWRCINTNACRYLL